MPTHAEAMKSVATVAGYEVMEKYNHVDVGDGVHPGQLIWCQATGCYYL